MPPGKVIEAGIRLGNGTKDFAWLVWQIGYSAPATVSFMNTNIFKQKPKGRAKNWMEPPDVESASKRTQT